MDILLADSLQSTLTPPVQSTGDQMEFFSVAALGRKLPLKFGLFSSLERPLSGKADI